MLRISTASAVWTPGQSEPCSGAGHLAKQPLATVQLLGIARAE